VNYFLFLILFCVFSFAEERPGGFWDFCAKIGINLGGTMPRPMPNNISKVENYSPNFAPTIEVEALRKINKKIGVSAGLRSDNKGMKSTAKVKEYSMSFGDFHGKFNGIVDTEMNFNYLSLPILAHYAFTENFSVYAGAYYAYLFSGEFKGSANEGTLNTGTNKTIVDHQEYDFSNELRHYDAGFSIGLNFLPYNEHILLSFDLNYGLLSVFPSDFKGISDDMQNVYGKFSVGYLF
jgi:hypothetical protein